MAKIKSNKENNNEIEGVKLLPSKVFKVEDINFAPYNPRDITEEELEKLKTSLRTYGYVNTILVNQQTMNIVGGNQRLRALVELGFKEVECKIVDLDINNEMALNLALNKISGTWNDEKLAEIFTQLESLDFNLGLTGFSSEEIDQITSLMPSAEDFDNSFESDGEPMESQDEEQPEDNLSEYYGIINFESKEQFESFQSKFNLSALERTVHYSTIESLFVKENN